ncbi:nuclear export mediator factor NEMF [Brachionus plicatilis]|uniref:Nuclear export mediator factor NEMF n=1 Tax=Brachionus plicatilis TaxID=10195 RepID=A0A3M7QFM1_BRAPC|nr:nuclear export mediator factor NEMF [Brachionus plicatilis]
MNKEAVKKLENVKKDHQRRLEELKLSQTEDEIRASLIEYNLDLVDKAIYLVNNAIANQMDWAEIHEIIKEAQEEEHEVALAIKELKLEINHIVLELEDSDFDDGVLRRKVEIDLGMNAFRNSRRYYESKKHSIIKENKTVDAGDKALKSAEKKTFELLKQASKIKTIGKSRKQYWFEKFFWFISSENYLVIGGRDQQQNEIVVKRYLKSGDLYVHADVQGASSVIIKNPSGNPVPPKTLNEAGCMAVCYSVAWEAKVLTSAYWVYHNQVSKQAPSGEYLKTGSFMIRGKKNFIPQTALVFGLGVLYKLDDNSVFRHKDERKIKTSEEEINELNVEYEELSIVEEDEELTSEKAISDLNIENVVDKQDDNRPETESKKSEESLKECEQTRKKESENQFPDTSFQIKLVSNINSAEDSFKTEEITAKENNDRQQEKSTTGPVSSAESNKGKSQPLKRGQKSRLEKMKTKYKDQDEEDRELIMQYLSPAGKPTKTDEKSIKSNEKSKLKGKQIDKSNKKNCQQLQQKPKEKQSDSNVAQYSKLAPDSTNSISKITQIEGNQESNANLNVNEDLEIEEDNTQDEIDVIDSLTGIPLDEDEILFCLTVCAPYSTLQNYKHKVKLIPGTSKRGQVVKTTIEMFNRDKLTTQREKDLIKSNLVSKEQDISRNLPGKVKLSAPNLNKLKKK